MHYITDHIDSFNTSQLVVMLEDCGWYRPDAQFAFGDVDQARVDAFKQFLNNEIYKRNGKEMK